MLTWRCAIAAAAMLIASGALYIRLRWRRSPQARRAMFVLAGCYIAAGAVVGAWVVGFWAQSPNMPSAQVAPVPLAQASPQAPAPLSSLNPEAVPPRGYRCGQDRWPVKTLSDADAGSVNLTPVPSTVLQLTALPKPSNLPPDVQNHRIAPVELTTYKMRALAVLFKPEEDMDMHMVIVDPNDFTKSMITEFVDWRCSGAISSKARDLFKQASAGRDALFGEDDSPSVVLNGQRFVLADLLGFRSTFVDPSTGKVFSGPKTGTPPPELIKQATVEVTGVGFWDLWEHGQTGVAPNGIELHPVLSVKRVGSREVTAR